MSTPAAIRFLKDGEPFSGVYISSDANLSNLITWTLQASKKIKWFPINIFSMEKRIKIRKMVAEAKGVEEKDVLFAKYIEDYAFLFGGKLFNMADSYGYHREDIYFDDLDEKVESSKEGFNMIEGFLSNLRLDSGYKYNVCYLVDIYFPDLKEYSLENTRPIVKITTGTGEELFTGTLEHLKNKKDELTKEE